MSPIEIIFLVTIGFLAGTSNALVGGGTLFTFPVLLAAGLPPIIANTTTTVALVPGTFTSAYAYLPELHRVGGRLPLRLGVATAGGLTFRRPPQRTTRPSMELLPRWRATSSIIDVLLSILQLP